LAVPQSEAAGEKAAFQQETVGARVYIAKPPAVKARLS
jgi:hypothetical protein